jgi:hypothetical protein
MKKINYLFFINSIRNVLGYLLIYSFIRSLISIVFSLDNNPLKNFMSVFFYIIFIGFIVGSISSKLIYKERGEYSYFIYIKYEIIVLIIVVILAELFIFN